LISSLSIEPPIDAPRECGTCTLCCKVFAIPEYKNPTGEWCPHCAPGVGCRVYEKRPVPCRTFACLWLNDPGIPDDWKPERTKIVLYIAPPNDTLYVNVDPGHPQAWRKPPFFEQLRTWSKELIEKDRHVVVLVREVATLILPDETIPLGLMKEKDYFVVFKSPGPTGMVYKVEVTHN
jgi:hypothetical protein